MDPLVRDARSAGSAAPDLKELLARWDREEAEIPWWVHLATLGGAIGLTLGLLAAIAAIQGLAKAAAYVGNAIAFAFVAGKPIVFMGAAAEWPLGPYELGALVLYLDSLTGIVFAYNLGFLHGIPWFGEKLRRVERASWAMLQGSRWMRNATFATLVLFVAVPLIGTGAMGGALLARVVGLRRGESAIAIAIGSALWSIPVAIFADHARTWLGGLVGRGSLAVVGIVAFLAVAAGYSLWFAKAIRRAREIDREG